MISNEQVRDALRIVRNGWWEYENEGTDGNVDPDACATGTLLSAFPYRDQPAWTTIQAWLRGDHLPRSQAWRMVVVGCAQRIQRALDEIVEREDALDDEEERWREERDAAMCRAEQRRA